jgi:antitoxin VapB
MTTAKVFYSGRSQAVRIPRAFRFDGREVWIRREGESVVLNPVHGQAWPAGFWRRIRIVDPAFLRPPQGQVPKRPALDQDG